MMTMCVCGELLGILLQCTSLGEVFGEQHTVPAEGYDVHICARVYLYGTQFAALTGYYL